MHWEAILGAGFKLSFLSPCKGNSVTMGKKASHLSSAHKFYMEYKCTKLLQFIITLMLCISSYTNYRITSIIICWFFSDFYSVYRMWYYICKMILIFFCFFTTNTYFVFLMPTIDCILNAKIWKLNNYDLTMKYE